jgi:hypothetical protein
MQLADLGVEQAQVVGDLGHRRDRGVRARRARRCSSAIDGWNAGDRVDVGSRERRQELPRVRRERLHEAPLPFGEDDVERERRLARAARPGDDAELAVRDRAETSFRLCSRACETG